MMHFVLLVSDRPYNKRQRMVLTRSIFMKFTEVFVGKNERNNII